MIIPWQVDVPQDRYPFCNWLLIASIIAAFCLQTSSIVEHKAKVPEKLKEFENHSVEDVAKQLGVNEDQLKKIQKSVDSSCKNYQENSTKVQISQEDKDKLVKKSLIENYFVWQGVRPYILDGYKIKGLFGHMWLHGGIIHLLGNMLFLWIFGNAVCAKIGNLIYLPIYIMFGLLAAFGHLIFSGSTMIGASGAIMGVVGMYLVFFPENEITCYWLIFPIYFKQFNVSSYSMILFWLGFDILGAYLGGGNVAHFAHLGGFVAGFAVAVLMLKAKWITMERYEKSLLEVIQGPKENSQGTYRSNPGMFPYDFQIQNLENTPIDIQQQQPEKEMPEEEEILYELEPPQQQFVRFVCACGKRVKTPIENAGKVARCPRCKKRIKIPNQQISPNRPDRLRTKRPDDL